MSKLAEHFWAKVDRRGDDECWPWTGKLNNGYPMMSVDGKARKCSHIAWSLANDAPFPADKWGLHHCDNPPCCNGLHIYPGTALDNAQDMYARGRAAGIVAANMAKTHCLKGHPLEGRNLYLKKNGWRICRTCQGEHTRAYRAKRAQRRQVEKG